MTQMPEAALARELGICYASAALVTDYDTGVEDDPGIKPVSQAEVFSLLRGQPLEAARGDGRRPGRRPRRTLLRAAPRPPAASPPTSPPERDRPRFAAPVPGKGGADASPVGTPDVEDAPVLPSRPRRSLRPAPAPPLPPGRALVRRGRRAWPLITGARRAGRRSTGRPGPRRPTAGPSRWPWWSTRWPPAPCSPRRRRGGPVLARRPGATEGADRVPEGGTALVDLTPGEPLLARRVRGGPGAGGRRPARARGDAPWPSPLAVPGLPLAVGDGVDVLAGGAPGGGPTGDLPVGPRSGGRGGRRRHRRRPADEVAVVAVAGARGGRHRRRPDRRAGGGGAAPPGVTRAPGPLAPGHPSTRDRRHLGWRRRPPSPGASDRHRHPSPLVRPPRPRRPLLVVGACGDDGGDDGAGPATTEAAATSSTTEGASTTSEPTAADGEPVPSPGCTGEAATDEVVREQPRRGRDRRGEGGSPLVPADRAGQRRAAAPRRRLPRPRRGGPGPRRG